MAERRKLVEGVTLDPAIEKEFVRSGSSRPAEPEPLTADAAAPKASNRNAGTSVSRSPLTTRIRSDYATALKRASLERQLQGIEPNTILDILEEALEPWLRNNGYLH
jgi:hypothetical protein